METSYLSDSDSEDSDIQMDPVENHDTSESDSSENEDELQCSLSLQKFLNSTELPSYPSYRKTVQLSLPSATKKSLQQRSNNSSEHSSGLLPDSNGLISNDEQSSESSVDSVRSEELDNDSRSFSNTEGESSDQPVSTEESSTDVVTAMQLWNRAKKRRIAVSTIHSKNLDSLSSDFGSETEKLNSLSLNVTKSTKSGLESFRLQSSHGLRSKLQPCATKKKIYENNDLDSMDSSLNEGTVELVGSPEIAKAKPINNNLSINKRTGIEKIRHHPARPRNYAYRKREWICRLCSKSMKYGSRFFHLRMQHGTTSYICPYCPFECQMRHRMKKHMMKHRGDRETTKFKCESCCKSFCFQETLDRHRNTVHSKGVFVLKCVICGDMFGSAIQLGLHYRCDHPGDKSFKCQQCDKAYSSSGALNLHIMGHHQKIKPYVCDVCEIGFTRKDKLEHHKNLHLKKNEKIVENGRISTLKCPHIKPTLMGTSKLHMCDLCDYVCTYCTYTFKSRRCFNVHTHKNFCTLCVIKFSNEKAHRLHAAYHEPEDIIGHRCEICKFGFSNIRFHNIHAVKMHGRVTDKPINYKCTTCSKTFKAQHLLTAHQKRIHQKDNHHKCDLCNDSFITVTLLKFHVHRKHTFERPHQCDLCNKGFVRQTDLNRHMKSHSDEKPFQCQICDLKLKSNRNLQLHIKIHDRSLKFPQLSKSNSKPKSKRKLDVSSSLEDDSETGESEYESESESN